MSDNAKVRCPECGARFGEKVVVPLIHKTLTETLAKFKEDKIHISDYARYAILEHIIDALEYDGKEANPP